MRFLGTLILILISVLIIFASFELKSWTIKLRSEDLQSFIKYNETQLNENLWRKYIKHKIQLNLISEKVLRINLSDVSPEDLGQKIKYLEQIKYAKLHNLELVLNQKSKLFNVIATITFP